jgi:hypothetical protein
MPDVCGRREIVPEEPADGPFMFGTIPLERTTKSVNTREPEEEKLPSVDGRFRCSCRQCPTGDAIEFGVIVSCVQDGVATCCLGVAVPVLGRSLLLLRKESVGTCWFPPDLNLLCRRLLGNIHVVCGRHRESQ